MGKFRNNQSGFTAVVSLLMVLVVAVIGFGGYYVWHSQKKTTTTDTSTTTKQAATTTKTNTEQTQPTDPYAGWKTYSNNDLALSFKYPADWKIVDDSSNLGTLIRVESADYLAGDYGSFSGTRVSVSPNTSNNTYAVDKQNASTKSGSNNDVKDLTVNGRSAFSYSFQTNETGYTSFVVEVDLGSKGAKEFMYQSNTNGTPQKYDTTNIAAFNKLVQSTIFQ